MTLAIMTVSIRLSHFTYLTFFTVMLIVVMPRVVVQNCAVILSAFRAIIVVLSVIMPTVMAPE
jgi:hypothetical protein